MERICKNQQQKETSAMVDYCQEEQLFVAMCFANKSTSESWLVDSGYENHMTNNQDHRSNYEHLLHYPSL